MNLELHDGRTFDDITDTTIETAFGSLSDPGDFIILRDRALGEVRAAGPNKGQFLLQCDLPASPGMFNGQLESISIDKAIDVFKKFRTGDTSWRCSFTDLNAPLSRRTMIVLALAATLFVALLLLAWLRTA